MAPTEHRNCWVHLGLQLVAWRGSVNWLLAAKNWNLGMCPNWALCRFIEVLQLASTLRRQFICLHHGKIGAKSQSIDINGTRRSSNYSICFGMFRVNHAWAATTNVVLIVTTKLESRWQFGDPTIKGNDFGEISKIFNKHLKYSKAGDVSEGWQVSLFGDVGHAHSTFHPWCLATCMSLFPLDGM